MLMLILCLPPFFLSILVTRNAKVEVFTVLKAKGKLSYDGCLFLFICGKMVLITFYLSGHDQMKQESNSDITKYLHGICF